MKIMYFYLGNLFHIDISITYQNQINKGIKKRIDNGRIFSGSIKQPTEFWFFLQNMF